MYTFENVEHTGLTPEELTKLSGEIRKVLAGRDSLACLAALSACMIEGVALATTNMEDAFRLVTSLASDIFENAERNRDLIRSATMAELAARANPQ